MEAFVLMQQARIDALESDMGVLLRERQQQRDATAATAAAAAAAAAAATAAAAPPPPLPVPAAALGVGLAPVLPPAPPARPPAAFTIVVVLLLTCFAVGCACLGFALPDIHRCNTPTSATITSLAGAAPADPTLPEPPRQTACFANITYYTHAGVELNGSVVVGPTPTGVCNATALLGTPLGICYHWQHPADFCFDKCQVRPYAKSRSILTAAIVLLILGGPMMALCLLACLFAPCANM